MSGLLRKSKIGIFSHLPMWAIFVIKRRGSFIHFQKIEPNFGIKVRKKYGTEWAYIKKDPERFEAKDKVKCVDLLQRKVTKKF